MNMYMEAYKALKITDLQIIEEDFPLKQPFVTSKRRIDVIRDYAVKLTTDEGLCGFGACAPTPVITGDTVGSILYAIEEFYKPLLIGAHLSEELLPAVQKTLFHNSSPKAAVDIALHDLLAAERGLTLFEYLGGKAGPKHLETDATVSLGTPAEMAEEAKKHISAGFTAIKVKLGGPKEEDVKRLKALSSVFGKKVFVRLDANQAWSVDDAVYVCSAAAEMGMNIELVEQPVLYTDLHGMAAVTRAVPFPVLADESVFSAEEAERLIEMGGCSMINIKLMKCGGIYGAKRIHKVASENGIPCMLGCMMEGPVSVTAAAHFAAAYGIDCLDLDPPYLCKPYKIEASVEYDGKNIDIHTGGKGLGITKIL